MEHRGIRVLIADDEKLARESMRDYLPWENMGMEVPVCVENGALALDYLCNHPVDIFIMDIRMPVMDGLKLLEEIGKRNLDVLIIVLSAYDQFEYAQKAIQSRKVFEYVLKPIKRKAFCELLEKAASEIDRREEPHRQESLFMEWDRLRHEYMAYTQHHQLDRALAVLENGLGAISEQEKDLEQYRRFFASLYMELQFLAVRQSAKTSGEYQRICFDGLKQIGNCANAEQIWMRFRQSMQELRPYLGTDEDHEARSKTSAVIEHCLEEIKRHYTETDFSLYMLAEEMQMNSNYLSSRFKSEMGVGFVEYINTLRIRTAQQLLKDMRYRTNEVAALVGFDNPKYFARVFKKVTGLVPSEYRSRIKNYGDMDRNEL